MTESPTHRLLRRVTVHGFRNLSDQSIPLGVGLTLFLGPNGQGKTNLLEAIALLSSGRSFRGATTADMIATEQRALRVVGELDEERGPLRLAVELSEKPTRSRRFLVGEKSLPASEWLGLLPAVAVTADRMTIVRGASEDRRRFLDRGVLLEHPREAELYRTVGRLLRQRGKLLAGRESPKRKRELLAAWNSPLAEATSRLRRARRQYTEKIAPDAARYFRQLGRPGELRLEYLPNPPGEDSVEDILSSFERAADSEIAAGRTRVGPGRDELDVTLAGFPARMKASAGEQKAIVLATKLAKVDSARRTGISPLLLLDDLDAELDSRVLSAFLSLLPKGHQIIATSAKPEWLLPLLDDSALRLPIEGGLVGAPTETDLPVTPGERAGRG